MVAFVLSCVHLNLINSMSKVSTLSTNELLFFIIRYETSIIYIYTGLTLPIALIHCVDQGRCKEKKLGLNPSPRESD